MTCEKAVDAVSRAAERVGPLAEKLATRVRELVDPAGGPRRGCVPFGAHETLVLEPAQRAVEVAHVDALAGQELGQRLEQLVAVGGALAEQEEERRLLEPLDARADGPAVRAAGAA